VGPSKAEMILRADPEAGRREMERAEAMGVRVMAFTDEEFPERLGIFEYLPVVLYYRGDPSILKSKTVAVVGTRYPSDDAKVMARAIGREVAKRGGVVVSGGAYGVDTHAHVGALEEGKTVVVLGSGFARPYPKENRSLFSKVADGSGLVVSEFPLDTPPLQGNFPARNRVISALSDAVVVVQAPAKSGALITASWALEQGKDVWAVPFSPLDRRAYGSNRLLYDGAKPLYDIGHFLDEILGEAPSEPSVPREALDELEASVLEALREPLHLDEIAYRTGIPLSRLYSVLLSLQMKGYVREMPGKVFKAVL